MTPPEPDDLLKTTQYFQKIVRVKHPGIQIAWIKQVMANPVKRIVQTDNRIVLWGNVADAQNRALRVVLLEDRKTVHNAFFDRNFLKRQQQGTEPQ